MRLLCREGESFSLTQFDQEGLGRKRQKAEKLSGRKSEGEGGKGRGHERRERAVDCCLKEKPVITEIEMKVIKRKKVGKRVRATCQSALVT